MHRSVSIIALFLNPFYTAFFSVQAQRSNVGGAPSEAQTPLELVSPPIVGYLGVVDTPSFYDRTWAVITPEMVSGNSHAFVLGSTGPGRGRVTLTLP